MKSRKQKIVDWFGRSVMVALIVTTGYFAIDRDLEKTIGMAIISFTMIDQSRLIRKHFGIDEEI